MQNKTIISVIVVAFFGFSGLLAYATYDEFLSPLIEVYLFGECELEIFSGRDILL